MEEHGRITAQAVSRWLPTAAARVRAQIRSCGILVDKVALGQVFSEYIGFPCQFSFHILLHTHLSSGTGTVGQLVADVPSGLSLTPPQETKKKKLWRNMLLCIAREFLGLPRVCSARREIKRKFRYFWLAVLKYQGLRSKSRDGEWRGKRLYLCDFICTTRSQWVSEPDSQDVLHERCLILNCPTWQTNK
jgi:hypothetical protein